MLSVIIVNAMENKTCLRYLFKVFSNLMYFMGHRMQVIFIFFQQVWRMLNKSQNNLIFVKYLHLRGFKPGFICSYSKSEFFFPNSAHKLDV